MNPILIVDDATTVRMYHRKVLSDKHWEVEEAVNGQEALERVLQRPDDAPFQLYIVDINMPKMDGYSFVRALRKLDHIPQAPVLMVSTESQACDANAARDAGANGYLIKPANPRELHMVAALMLGDVQRARISAQAISGEST
jgi:two-component system, chemotaxis family, chemotaxis protein CheY